MALYVLSPVPVLCISSRERHMDAPVYVNACCPKVVVIMGGLKFVCLKGLLSQVSLFMYGAVQCCISAAITYPCCCQCE